MGATQGAYVCSASIPSNIAPLYRRYLYYGAGGAAPPTHYRDRRAVTTLQVQIHTYYGAGGQSPPTHYGTGEQVLLYRWISILTIAQAGRGCLPTYYGASATSTYQCPTKQVPSAENVNRLSAVARGTATQTLRVGDPHSTPACQQLEFAIRVFLNHGDESLPLQQVL